MLAKRTFSAVLIALIGGMMIFAGGWIYTIGIAFFLALAAWEFVHMFIQAGHQPGAVRIAATTFVLMVLRHLNNPVYFSAGMMLAVFTVSAANLFIFRNKKDSAAVDFAVELATLSFIALPGSFLIQIRMLPQGLFWTLVCVLCASLGDVGAYVFGSIFGRHKFSPQISPNKTVEGYVGGIILAVLTGILLSHFFQQLHPDIHLLISVLLSATIGIIAPLGDLSKSIIKRSFSLKDTGNLIPGHGGMLDRIDTILWAAPITFFFFQFLG